MPSADWRDPTPAALLDVWEHGGRLSSTRRALALLSVVDETDWAERGVGERDAALLDLRERLFGPLLAAVVACPGCAERQELAFRVGEIRAVPDGGQLHLGVDGVELTLRLPTSADVERAAATGDVEQAVAELLRACAPGAPAAALALVEERMARADPQADVTFALRCDACGTAWSAPFDVAAFLWAELDAWAWRLLADVHRLASAYGWSEPEVLALSPQRRAIYLQLVAG
ncbi:hypothetical protein [Actinomycetospora chibensis]|uniref:Phage baseplate protein n=1 Tax=Actinomycetospora chibensis TaxID=663606 RepID=A0ABV9RM08_9PSEU|nr:hypothetical protein [Actinomycetospora chibensis]MDD7926969.1 hypothetical protein [Actinomycetospora chibensis]